MPDHLRVLVVDDEPPARGELAYMIGRLDSVASVQAVGSGIDALRALESTVFDAVFLDIAMPGLSGLDLARVLARFETPPAVVFVTAHDEHAVAAFELDAVDYLLKPVREARVREAVRRVLAHDIPAPPAATDLTIPVELGGVTRFVRRSDIHFVEAHGDYVRLHTADGAHLVRLSLGNLERDWADAGFLRIHRSYLVCVRHITELRQHDQRCIVVIDGHELEVSRRRTRDLKDVLLHGTSGGGS
ncbi:LytR/AlgR family response regulator transcription factor [Flexivirga caeni]|uniref:DNA-binding response regulator n=1 Tax=Flexivirga caeni TaxID=2294115 RepID=A0A3M9MFK9_9MICO|nr:LytTR family DNA-binding domain-containing protein [Flexivirga caeni]RNI24331.1 DNA-binding response regulator [Flexivirga caeni]